MREYEPGRAAVYEEPLLRYSREEFDEAPSVSGTAPAETALNGRSHTRGWPWEVATNASVGPSGEIVSDVGSVVGGVLISTRLT